MMPIHRLALIISNYLLDSEFIIAPSFLNQKDSDKYVKMILTVEQFTHNYQALSLFRRCFFWQILLILQVYFVYASILS